MSDSIIEETQQEEIDAAHGQAQFFRGQRLEPFSIERQWAFQRIAAQGASTLEAAVLIVFLCSLGEAAVEGRLTGIDIIDIARGELGIRSFRKRMAKWAGENEISMEGESAQQAIDIATSLWKAVENSQFKAEKSQSGGNG